MLLERGARITAFVLDALVTLLGALSAWIIITGGSVMFVRGQRISLTGVDNPLLGLTLLLVIRWVAFRSIPWLGVPRWSLTGAESLAQHLITRTDARISALTRQRARRMVVGALLAATAVKLLLAWANPGFFSGDDVEVQEMSLRLLWRTDWPIWDLRRPFFPVGIVYPGQRLVAASGMATSAAALIFTGRAAVAVLSSIAIWLVWRIGRRLWPERPGWALVAALMFATAKLHIAFGSSELPRPVATVAVLGAFLLLQDPRAGRVLASAALIGVAICFRFSEVVFLGPAVVALAWQRRWLTAIAMVGIAGAVALAIIGASDGWYWGQPFHSLRAAVDYTLVEKLSSRGYQSVGWYVWHAAEWINPAVGLLALLATIRAPRVIDLWAWVPLLILSALPHKEARYAIPIAPFLCLIATRGLILVASRLGANADTAHWRPAALLGLLAIGLVQDIGHWRLPRSNADVEFAKRANEMLPRDVIVGAEQGWRLGGRLYLRSGQLVDLDPDRLQNPDYLWQQTPAPTWMILDRRTTERSGLLDALRERGYQRDRLIVEGSRYELWKPGDR